MSNAEKSMHITKSTAPLSTSNRIETLLKLPRNDMSAKGTLELH